MRVQNFGISRIRGPKDGLYGSDKPKEFQIYSLLFTETCIISFQNLFHSI